MLSLLSSLFIAQAAPTIEPKPKVEVPKPEVLKPEAPKPQTVVQPQSIRVLPGRLDDILVFNSNSPEVVQTEGILLSTFPKEGKSHPEAHLNLSFDGRFDIFAHHISNQIKSPTPLKTLYLGILLHNPGTEAITIKVLQAASYLSQPDAPFIDLPAMTENPMGAVFAGPGDRVTNDILRRQRQSSWPATLVIPAGASAMLLNAPIPVKELDQPINGRSTLAYLRSSGSVYVASLGMYAKTDEAGQERAPNLSEWETLLETGQLSQPRDKVPTLPDAKGPLIYGRVSGVAKGSRWQAQITDPGKSSQKLTIPTIGNAFSYPLSALNRGTFGTGQVQSAPMVVRYPDTAYAAHGNYCVQYNLALPLYNPTQTSQKVAISLQTPLKTDAKSTELSFLSPPPKRVFFRGTVRVRYKDDAGNAQSRYVQLVQFRGQQGEPLVELNLEAQTSRLVQVDFLYPPDATPPQVLTVQTKP
jgi:hypothetical protein